MYLVLSVRVKEESGVEGSVVRAKKYKCVNDGEARKVKIIESKMILNILIN